MPRDKADNSPHRGAACPICGRATDQQWRPFCSRRCADLDLGRWMTGAYAVPADDIDPPEPDDGD